MSIRFACDCGRQLTAPEEYTGKRVKCSACGEIQTVPAAARRTTPAPAPPPPADGVIRFRCDCGQACQVRSEHAGKNIRCPKCATVLTAPGRIVDDEAEEDRRRPAAIQANKPLARGGRRPAREEEEDEDYDEERPSKRKKGKQKSRLWIWLSATAALVLIAGGVTWWLLSGGVSGDFDLVPRDAQGFVTVRVADLLNTPLGKKSWEKASALQPQELKALEDKVGLTVKDVERITFVMGDFEKEAAWAIIKTSKNLDKDKILQLLKGAAEQSHEGKKYYLDPGQKAGIAFISDRVLVFGSEPGLKMALGIQKPKSGPLDAALKRASKGKYQIAGGINVSAALMEMARKKMGPGGQIPPDALELKTASLAIAVGDDVRIDAVAEFSAKDKAKSVAASINAVLALVKANAGDKLKGVSDARQSGKDVEMSMRFEKSTLDQADKMAESMMGPVLAKIRGAAGSTQALNNFRQLAMAFHNYNDQLGHFPQAAILNKNGQPLLSWRVAILPYIEQDALYRQFHLNEPWNSAHNRTLLNRMPKTFEIPGAVAAPGQTFIQVFTGPNTPFPGGMQKLRIPASFPDGTSNTVLLAESARPVNWTAPDDMKLDFTPPTFLVGNHTGRGTLVSLVDGSVRTVPQTVSVQTWKAAISPAGGEVLGADWGRP